MVVGILIALQINNWNEGRKQEQQRLELIENLKRDFALTFEGTNETLEQLETITTKFEEFLEAAGSNHTDLSAKELRAIIEAALKTIEYQPVLGTLNSAQSTGEIGLIKDSVFINLIARLESHLRIWNDLSRVFRDQRLLLQQPQLRKKFGSLRGTIRTSTHFNPPRYAL